MGKVFQNKLCDICGFQGKVIETWGKKYCRSCWDKKPKQLGTGHSGMLKAKSELQQDFLAFDNKLKLIKVPKGNKLFATIFLEHYPKSKGIVGRQCNYLIERAGKILGIIGANSPPLNYIKFNKFFNPNGIKKYTEFNWLNNNVFRLLYQEKNLGTKVLKLFRQQLKKDYETQYKDKLIGLITFIEPPRLGSLYKADNWIYLGITQGKECKRRGSHGKWINKEWLEGTKKYIYTKWL